jgi:hypothetical protein
MQATLSEQGTTALVALLLEQHKLFDWQVAIHDISEVLVIVRPSRKLVTVSRDFVGSDGFDVLASQVENALSAPWQATYEPGDYVAECRNCYKLYFRTKPADRKHFCADCGPEVGGLRYE